MFSPGDRAALRAELIERASRDPRIAAAALTGSAAEDREDRWSDIDLAFSIAEGADMQDALVDWTAFMADRHAAIHYIDMVFGAWIYRVFFLPGTLQVDLAFVPAAEFRGLSPTFRLLFGTARETAILPAPDPRTIIGMAWLYAIHARTAIARGKPWQAAHMIAGVRDHALTLACLRCGEDPAHARGADRLPPEVLATFELTLVRSTEPEELSRAFAASMDAFLIEAAFSDAALAGRLSVEAHELLN